ncbi:hypothetical protein MPDQ_006319 [Monascus purpureus]|uniref:Zn(2)-C6 fungal-type domain-containing protein n=1 Tax=Monascus purpureus TaxID=5098 RepID=A0A507QUL6_MONPU|nr:hypothetical protein MPDQ_006319 [Monascus purpureus]
MPGILPMKVIKVGNGTQSRIAQACDRCRSKKIRCDGIRPSCSQCASVGFECKTSDKLSRRAFPRGYTESLEERVRALEAEVRELKSLLDEKDEKIDVLSRIRSFSPPSQKLPSPPASQTRASPPQPKPSVPSISGEDVIQVQQDFSQSSKPTPDAPYTGLSSTRGFADSLTRRLAGEAKLSSQLSTRTLTALPPPLSHIQANPEAKTPPRIVSDQLINIFFQEWAPMYPVVHRPTILKAYEQYLGMSGTLPENSHIMTQLNLIFGVAALSSTSRTSQDPTFFEGNWFPALEALSSNISIPTMQCLVLAQVYCMAKGDYRSLVRYRSLAVGLCHQLGLHQDQKRFSLDPLATETRKKVFWCQYVLDRFASALTGLPILLREEDIRTEYPVDVDDENVTESGFLPTLPGESTRLSSAIALFGASRILGKALEELYHSEQNYEIVVSKLRSISDQLDEWQRSLPSHLRLEFVQDKPSTNVTSSRSLLLSLAYYFIRSLIHRPAVCFGSKNIKPPSMLALSSSSKHIVQIMQLLDERRLCLSLSFNRKELVFLSGLALLWQNVDVKRESKIAQESQRLLKAVVDLLKTESMPAAAEFSVLANALMSWDGGKRVTAKLGQAHELLAPPQKFSPESPNTQLQAWKARMSTSAGSGQALKHEAPSRRATVSGGSPPYDANVLKSPNRANLSLTQQGHLSTSDLKVDRSHSLGNSPGNRSEPGLLLPGNLDPGPGPLTTSDWEYVVSDMDRGFSNIFNGIYGGKECGDDGGPFTSLKTEYEMKRPDVPLPLLPQHPDLRGMTPDPWSGSTSDLHTDRGPQSVFSYSEESMASVDDGAPIGDAVVPFRGIIMPATDDNLGGYGLSNGWRRLAV